MGFDFDFVVGPLIPIAKLDGYSQRGRIAGEPVKVAGFQFDGTQSAINVGGGCRAVRQNICRPTRLDAGEKRTIADRYNKGSVAA